MGIFSKKTEEKVEKATATKSSQTAKAAVKPAKVAKTKVAKTKAVSVAGAATTSTSAHNGVIIGPRITEKATMKADTENVFVFEITSDATKHKVRKAITAMYNVVPVKVSVARNPGKTVFYRGRIGNHSGVKKAYVYLKKGDKIEII